MALRRRGLWPSGARAEKWRGRVERRPELGSLARVAWGPQPTQADLFHLQKNTIAALSITSTT